MRGIATLCGSTKFKAEFEKVNMELTMGVYWLDADRHPSRFSVGQGDWRVLVSGRPLPR